MDRVRTALIGCGKVGQIHALALAALPESEFVAACDVDLPRATTFATRFGVRPYGDVARMLEECGVQALASTPRTRSMPGRRSRPPGQVSTFWSKNRWRPA
ncbi:MAG TPA: Gfo/Idh/MocA family oxidoreductase [Isosphaeraceae bacterium]|nr:Gfo/Idh/MocA family oxidoreductase [Isosphaeraceae bacterium]